MAWVAQWAGDPSASPCRGIGGFSVAELMRRRPRTASEEERLQRWLSEVDEFGMMVVVVKWGL
jgi:hypothetical protein